MYNIALRHVLITVVLVEKQQLLHILHVVCTLSYPACEVHVIGYIIICGLSGYGIFSHIIS